MATTQPPDTGAEDGVIYRLIGIAAMLAGGLLGEAQAGGLHKCPDGAGSYVYQDRACARSEAPIPTVPLPAPGETPEHLDSVHAFCEQKWPRDPRMQRYCYKAQSDAALVMAAYLQRFPKGSEELAIVVGCADRWQVREGMWDVVLARHCAELGLRAHRAGRSLEVISEEASARP